MSYEDPNGVRHEFDDSMRDGFMWCGKSSAIKYTPSHDNVNCLLCIVKQAYYRGLR